MPSPSSLQHIRRSYHSGPSSAHRTMLLSSSAALFMPLRCCRCMYGKKPSSELATLNLCCVLILVTVDDMG